MADWVLVNETLDISQMESFISCLGLPPHIEPLLQFDSSMTQLETKGSTVPYNLTVEEVCHSDDKALLVMFPYVNNYEDALKLCRSYGGTLTLPLSEEENINLISISRGYDTVCSGSWSTVTWVGVKASGMSQKWISQLDLLPIQWDGFHPLYASSDRNCSCATAGSPNYPKYWYCTPCHYSSCQVCQFQGMPVLTLRGLREHSVFDHHYTIAGKLNQMPKFVGLAKSLLVWEEEHWKLKSTIENITTYAKLLGVKSDHPIGRKEWMFSEENGRGEKVRTF